MYSVLFAEKYRLVGQNNSDEHKNNTGVGLKSQNNDLKVAIKLREQCSGVATTNDLQLKFVQYAVSITLVLNILLTNHFQHCSVENHISQPVFLLTPSCCASSSSTFLSLQLSSVCLRVCIHVSFTLSLFSSLLHSFQWQAVIVAVGPGWRCSVLSQDLSRPGNMAARRGGGRWLTRHFYP